MGLNGVEESLAARLLADMAERMVGTKTNTLLTVAGVLAALGLFFAGLTGVLPAQYTPFLQAGAVVAAAAGALLKADSGKGADPGKLAVSALVMLTLAGTLPTVGCTASGVAQDIVNWTPTLQSAIATVDTTARILLPADAPIFAAATVGFDAGSNIVVALAKSYLANPNASVLVQLQAAIVTLQQQVNAGVLQAAHIVDPNSQRLALAALNGVATIVNTMLGLVQQIGGKSLAALAPPAPVKVAMVAPYLDRDKSARVLAAHYGESVSVAYAQMDAGQAQLTVAGF